MNKVCFACWCVYCSLLELQYINRLVQPAVTCTIKKPFQKSPQFIVFLLKTFKKKFVTIEKKLHLCQKQQKAIQRNNKTVQRNKFLNRNWLWCLMLMLWLPQNRKKENAEQEKNIYQLLPNCYALKEKNFWFFGWLKNCLINY